MKKIILYLLLLLSPSLSALVGPIVPGQSLWWVTKRIGTTSDIIESKLDALTACEEALLDSSDISGGTITLATAGVYRLAEDVTVNIVISAGFVFLNLNSRRVIGTIAISGSFVLVENGFVLPPSPQTDPPAAITIDALTSSMVKNVTIECEASTADLAGRDGIEVEDSGGSGNFDNQIIGCTVRAGAGSGGARGGHGIVVKDAVTRTAIQDCIIFSGAGGESSFGGAPGGDGGNGIHIVDASDAEIDGCTIMETGAGGANTGGGAGGNGGHGIRVMSGSTDVAVHDSIIRTTGGGGTGPPDGQGGKAVDDDVTDSGEESVFLRNFAHNISNQIKYDLQATNTEQGTVVGQPPGNTVLADGNQFVNAYMTVS